METWERNWVLQDNSWSLCESWYKWNCASIFRRCIQFDLNQYLDPWKQSWNADLGICCIKFFIIKSAKGWSLMFVTQFELSLKLYCSQININELPVPAILFMGSVDNILIALLATLNGYIQCYYHSYIFHLSRLFLSSAISNRWVPYKSSYRVSLKTMLVCHQRK